MPLVVLLLAAYVGGLLAGFAGSWLLGAGLAAALSLVAAQHRRSAAPAVVVLMLLVATGALVAST
ncbi:MAG: hypothetical protein ACHQWU_14975, partial [Gemmatimonadales bacterium]